MFSAIRKSVIVNIAKVFRVLEPGKNVKRGYVSAAKREMLILLTFCAIGGDKPPRQLKWLPFQSTYYAHRLYVNNQTGGQLFRKWPIESRTKANRWVL
jgi:hypothetical protein